MVLLARENIDPKVKDTQFLTPFFPEAEKDDNGGSPVLMDGKPHIPKPKKRQIRQEAKKHSGDAGAV